jgi:hypothetical protein
MAYHVDHGQIGGLDVSGLTIVSVVQIPGNVQKGHWRQVLFVDDRAASPQRDALEAAFSGRLGGSLGELAALVSDRVAVHSASIDYSLQRGVGSLRVATRAAATAGSAGSAPAAAVGANTKVDLRVEASDGAQSLASLISNARCAVVPASPASLGQAPLDNVNLPEHAMTWTCTGRDGISGTFHAES